MGRASTPATLVALGLLAASAPAQEPALPISGKPVPELAAFDQAMVDFMQPLDIEAGILGVMKDGVVVYLRGFGYLDPGLPALGIEARPLSENSMMRLASVEKPLTVAAIRKLVSAGQLSLDDRVFDLGQEGGGILSIEPFGILGSAELQDITVQHLIDHKGGWDSSVGWKPFTNEFVIEMAQEMGVPSPPTREQTVAYMLGQPLEFAPGASPAKYSNFGYMLLGLIVEERSQMTHQQWLREAVFGPDMWVSSTELHRGRTFKEDQSDREPWYRTPAVEDNVFDPSGPKVSAPYGGWSHEAFVGSGNLVASAAPLLYFLDEYYVTGSNVGKPLGGGSWFGAKGGALYGTSTSVQQRNDGINIVVLFDEWGTPHHAGELRKRIVAIIDAEPGLVWPTESVDGFWVEFAETGAGQGGYHDPLEGIDGALEFTGEGARWRLRSGATSWTGTLDRRLLIDAPMGVAVLGE